MSPSLYFGQAAQVMRQELLRLKKCFAAAMTKLAGLDNVPEGEALSITEAMDGKIKG